MQSSLLAGWLDWGITPLYPGLDKPKLFEHAKRVDICPRAYPNRKSSLFAIPKSIGSSFTRPSIAANLGFNSFR
jgi:hypothetical protein